jgi:shikimate kinase
LKKNLTLTGMMGVGKSVIGKILAKGLSMQFVDLDRVIEKNLNMTIQKIFETKGEFFFRSLEEKIALQEVKKKNTVISLGGGAFMNPRIRKQILLSSKSFWLDLDIESIEIRVKNLKKRPLLNTHNIKNTLEKIYKERKKTYELANYKINCNKLSANLIANKIIKLYGNN